jgi:hypothetical protein
MTVGLATAACKSLCNTSRYGWGTLRSCVEEHLPTVTRPRLEKRVRGSSTNLLDAGRKIPQQYVATELLRHVTLAFQVSTSSEAVHVSEEPRESGDGWIHTLPGRCLFRNRERLFTFGSIATSQLGAWLHLCRSCSFFPTPFPFSEMKGNAVIKLDEVQTRYHLLER